MSYLSILMSGFGNSHIQNFRFRSQAYFEPFSQFPYDRATTKCP